MSRRFQRTVEDFICGHCGQNVQGTGYTNHCPRCLWSKHVDINPGDRLAKCGGLMEPLAVEGNPGAYRILHRCSVCGFESWNKAAVSDDFAQLLTLAENSAKRTLGY
ncbi:MAG TPA: RNHCP domain-containing protein [Terriglobales bacterium]|nr:RNHCP domain-containing protein [Terriglobales bacterium]